MQTRTLPMKTKFVFYSTTQYYILGKLEIVVRFLYQGVPYACLSLRYVSTVQQPAGQPCQLQTLELLIQCRAVIMKTGLLSIMGRKTPVRGNKYQSKPRPHYGQQFNSREISKCTQTKLYTPSASSVPVLSNLSGKTCLLCIITNSAAFFLQIVSNGGSLSHKSRQHSCLEYSQVQKKHT